MAIARDPEPAKAPAPEHLTVRSDGGPPEVRFLFARQEKRMGGAIGASVFAHLAFLVVLVILVNLVPERIEEAVLPDNLSEQIVWIAEPGPGGGGGGGNELPEPPQVAELPGPDPISVPVLEPPDPAPVEIVEDEPEPEPLLNIPARSMASATVTAPGVVAPSAAPISRSTGSGRGSGAGAGEGSGLGEGTGGGFGGGVFRIGSGVESPRLLQSARPDYTSEAMRAKVQGVVQLEGVVLPDGTVGDVRVIRSLDAVFGLDEEAIRAARRFRFEPGRRFGEPVAVLVSFEIEFTLR